jgi:hypothetical protein
MCQDSWGRRTSGGLARSHFITRAASTQAFRALKATSGGRVIGDLERIQRADGSWTNPENLVKEDDPFIATAHSSAGRGFATFMNISVMSSA